MGELRDDEEESAFEEEEREDGEEEDRQEEERDATTKVLRSRREEEGGKRSSSWRRGWESWYSRLKEFRIASSPSSWVEEQQRRRQERIPILRRRIRVDRSFPSSSEIGSCPAAWRRVERIGDHTAGRKESRSKKKEY